MPPQRIQLRRTNGWRMPPDTVKVDRSTRWGNPFRVDADTTAAACVERYARLLSGEHDAEFSEAERALGQRIRTQLPHLAGKDLACWCPLHAPCHADVLLRLANA